MRKNLHFTHSLALVAFIVLMMMGGKGWGQVNNTTPVLLDNYDGVGDLTYTANAASQWSIAGGIYVAGTNALSTPEHSCTSYDLTNSISGWNLAKANQNVWNGYFKILRTTSGWGTSNYGCGSVIACNLADFSSASAQGYALVIENGTPDKITLVKFSQGIKDGSTNLPANATAIVSVTVDPGTTGFNYLVELLSDGKWKISYLTGSQLSDANAIIKTSYSGGNATSTSADETYTGISFKYSGWIFSHSSGNTTTDKANFDNMGAAQGSTNSSSSDIITNASFTYPTNITYSSNQGTTPLITGNSIEVAQFDIRDGGSALTDADLLATTLTALTFNVTNPGSIRRIALFDGTTNLGEVAGGATASFSGLTLAAADNGSKTFSVRASFLSGVTDNQQFSFTVNSATASGSGSGFATANAGGAVTSTSGDNNRIEVTATAIIFDQDVSIVALGALMSPSPTLMAIDANVNYDLDYVAGWSVAVTAGTATFDGTATTSGSFSGGVATFNNLKFNTAGTANNITVTSGSYTDASGSFDVTNPQPEINIKENVTNYLTGSTYGFGSQLSGSGSSAITFTIENLGTATLNLSGSPIVIKSGANASEFTINQTSTSTTVAASGSTTFTVTFSPTSQGSKSAQLSIANDDATGSENPYLINLTGASTVSSASDLATTSGYSYTSNVAYENYQTAATLTTGNSVGVNGLTINDGGATTDADNLGTTLTAISFTTDGSTAIRTAALFDGSANVGEVAVNGATTIAFSSLNLIATDGGTKDFELRVTYQSAVTDNQQITFTVSSATASTAGSGFAVGNAGAPASTATFDINRIEVTATALAFGVNPSNVTINAGMTPSPTVVAKDANVNLDLDFTGSVTLTSTGTISGSATNPVSAIGGTATFSNLIFSVLGTGRTIAAISGSLTATGNSNTFNVAVQAAGILLFEDDFSYSGLLTANGYTNLSGTTNYLNSGATGLSYSNYGSSGIGNALAVTNTGEDVSKLFTQQNSPSTVYASFLVNISASLTGDYVFALAPSSGATNYRGRVFIKASSTSGYVNFGIANGSTGTTYGTNNFPLNTTHLVVLKYQFTSGVSATATVFINPNLYSAPSSYEVSVSDNTTTNAPADISYFVIRQGTNTQAPTFILDGLRIATNWGTLLGNPQYDAASNIAAGNYNDVNVLSNTLSLTGDVAINGTTTNNSAIAIGAHTFSINGVLSGSGTYTGGATSNIAVGGPGASLNFPAIINGLNNLSITRPNGISLGATSQLTVSGTLTNSAGNTGLVINSGGSLIQNSAGVNATVNRDITDATNNNWHYFISSITSSIQATTSSCFNGAYLDRYNEPTGAWVRLLTNQDVLPETGYSLNYLAGTHTLVFPGTLKSSPVSYTDLSFTPSATTNDDYAAGWHLVGNPYPCGINPALCSVSTDMNAYAYVPNGATGNYDALTIGTASVAGTIASLQGFFVRATSGTNSLTLANAAKVHGGTFFKSNTTASQMLSVSIAGNNYSDKTYIKFNPEATANFDQAFDAYKRSGIDAAPQLYSILPGEKAAVNTLPNYTTNPYVSLGLKVGAATTYTLTVDGISSFDPQLPLRLDDLKLGISQDLRAYPTYSFTASPGDTENRFRLRFASAIGIDEHNTTGITVYATPGIIHISRDNTASGTAYLYSVSGQLLSISALNPGETLLRANAQGVYMVKVVSGKTLFTQKVVVTQ